jgi:hypothetical protein
VQAIVECMQRNQSDLLVLGLHRHSSLFSRLWNHTTHDLSQQMTSSILGSLKSASSCICLWLALRHKSISGATRIVISRLDHQYRYRAAGD